MRDSLHCPKCKHNRILAIDTVPEAGVTGVVGTSLLGHEHHGGVGVVSAVVCRRCGYTELYTSHPAEIHVDGKHVRELAGPDPEPYR